MNSLTILLLITVESLKSDWVEIKQVSNQKLYEESIYNNYKTTPVPYEVFMKTPQDDFKYTTPLNYENSHNSNDIVSGITTTTMKTGFSTNSSKEKISHKIKSSTENRFFSSKGKKKEKNKNGSTPNSQGFLTFLNNIQQHLLEYKNKTIKNKISILQQLRDNMLLNIEDRISDFWIYEKSSEARTYKDDDDDHHHMEFPSNEGALMTIGFLTFAVFLIKLVLKLIYALKYKQYIASTAVANGGTVTVIGRKKRDLTDDDIRLLKLIEEYEFA